MILSLDLATITGYCIGSREIPPFIVRSVSFKTNSDNGLKLLSLYSFVESLMKQYEIDEIVYERPTGSGPTVLIHQSKMCGVVELLAAKFGAKVSCISSKTIKKFATGNGNASKDEMIQFAARKYKHTVSNDNEADALHLFHLYTSTNGK